MEIRTPEAVPENLSNTHAISMRVHDTETKVANDSNRARVVIDGKSHSMVKRRET
jgi:hypothetical protein